MDKSYIYTHTPVVMYTYHCPLIIFQTSNLSLRQAFNDYKNHPKHQLNTSN